MSSPSPSGQSPRVILHADMDAFYAAVEQRDHPELRGKPVIIGGDGRRGVVSTASYEARKYGVHSAMPGAIAKRKCPGGIFVRPRMNVYVQESERIRAVFEQFTPMVEPLSLDEAFLDVTASQRLFGDGAAIAQRIRTEVFDATNLTVSVGVASNKYVAKVASDADKPDGLVVVPPGEERAFLAPLPVRCLWGAGRVAQERLAAYGLQTIADVQALSEVELVGRFGESAGAHFYRLSNGLDSRPVVADHDAKSISHETTFGHDLRDPEESRAVLLELSEMVGRRLRRAARQGRTVRLKLRFPPFRTLSRQVRLPSGTDQDLEIYRAVVKLFDAAHGSQPVRLLGVGVADLHAGDELRQGNLFEAPPAQSRALSDAMDSIRDKFGEDAVRRAGGRRRVDSEQPGRYE